MFFLRFVYPTHAINPGTRSRKSAALANQASIAILLSTVQPHIPTFSRRELHISPQILTTDGLDCSTARYLIPLGLVDQNADRISVQI